MQSIEHDAVRARTPRGRILAAVFTTMLAATSLVTAQSTGELRGKITQSEGEPVVGAVVTLPGTKLGAVSDLNGVFTVRRVPVGRHRVKVTGIGYTTQEFTDVDVRDGVTKFDVVLAASAVRGDSVIVRGRARSGTESALLAQRRNAASVSDGISQAQIRRLPDATSADALSRVTGISIVGNRFAFIRGTSERYNNTQLNGVAVASTEPDKKAFSFDLVPSNLLENTVVSKTFTPDMPGDFSGGLVQMNTIDFPDESNFRLSVTGGFADGTTFDRLMLGRRGGSDYLASGISERALPTSIPETKLTSTTYKKEELAAFGASMPNNWTRSELNAPVNGNFLLSYGGRTTLFDNDFGVVAALSYRNGYQFTPIVRADKDRFAYRGSTTSYNVLWGGLMNLSYKLSDLHSISIRNVYSKSAEDDYTQLAGSDYYAGIDKKIFGFHYVERGVYSGQIGGSHLFPQLGNVRVEWKGHGSLGSRDEPDYRRLGYARYDPSDTSQPFIVLMSQTAPNGLLAGRLYTHLDEEAFGFSTDVTIPAGTLKFKVGGAVENKTRDFRARLFGYTLGSKASELMTADLDTLFDASHFGADRLNIEEVTNPSDRYDAHLNLQAVYAMADIPFELFGGSFRTILGARLEDARLQVNTADIRPIHVDYPTSDLLPSVNLIYQPLESMNVRLAYSKTLARPEFREYAKFPFYDFTTDALVYGNPTLERARIDNYDFRIEYFPNPGELLAVSLFHKEFTDAIEEVALNGDIPERTWANAESSRNTGVEFELRKSFDFLGDWFSRLGMSINYTWLDSRVDVTASEFFTGKEGRRLQGQSPYMINGGLYFNEEELGLSMTLAYNRFGERITQVARSGQEDYIEQPRDVVDFSASKTFMERYELKLAIKDILHQDQIFKQGDLDARINGKQTSVSLTISARL